MTTKILFQSLAVLPEMDKLNTLLDANPAEVLRTGPHVPRLSVAAGVCQAFRQRAKPVNLSDRRSTEFGLDESCSLQLASYGRQGRVSTAGPGPIRTKRQTVKLLRDCTSATCCELSTTPLNGQAG
jgi:hypothetical protein